MSFSKMMDEMVPIEPTYEFEGPTRPVTPSNDHTDGKGQYLYHSESVAKVLNQLSKDLSGVCDRNLSMPTIDGMGMGMMLLSDERDKLAVPQANNLSVNPPHSPQPPQTSVGTSSPLPFVATPHASPAQNQPKLKPDSLHHFISLFGTQGAPATIDPIVLSPNQNIVPGIASSSSSTTASPLDQPSIHTAMPLFPTSQPSTSSSTQSPDLAIPVAKVLSPTPSTPDLSLEGAETEDEDGTWQPPRRSNPITRLTRPAPATTQRTRNAPKTQARTEQGPPPTPSVDSPQSLDSVPIAPDAEANSDYQASENGSSPDAAMQLSDFSGGPSRERSKNRRGAGATMNHPYKPSKQVQSVGNGRQMCTYVSPYDGWRCEQVLGRAYDLPRHMEVHAKEEYELVLTGRLDPQHSGLFQSVTEANVYVCLICKKDFSRKDAMNRHIRTAAKMSKARHIAEMKTSLKKRILGIPIHPPPAMVPSEVIEGHRRILEKLRIEAEALGQDVSDWDVENMIPQVEANSPDLFGTSADAPGIPVGRRTGKRKMDDGGLLEPIPRSTRASNRAAKAKGDEMDLGLPLSPPGQIPPPPPFSALDFSSSKDTGGRGDSVEEEDPMELD